MSKRLNKAAKEYNVSIATIVEYLGTKNIKIDSNPNTKIEDDVLAVLDEKFADDKTAKQASENVSIAREKRESLSLKDIKKVLGDRPMAIARELTKLYEEVRRGRVSALLEKIVSDGAPKGEIVLIIGENKNEEIPNDTIEGQLKEALKILSVRDAAELVSGATGKPKKAIYMLALKLSGKT